MSDAAKHLELSHFRTENRFPPRIMSRNMSGAGFFVAVGTLITERPPHRSVRAAFPHTAPTSGV